MKTAKKIADTFFPVIDSPAGQWMNDNLRNAIKEYAKSCAQDALNRAAENARTTRKTQTDGYECWTVEVVNKDSIKKTEIILP